MLLPVVRSSSCFVPERDMSFFLRRHFCPCCLIFTRSFFYVVRCFSRNAAMVAAFNLAFGAQSLLLRQDVHS
jgi:hypothetical protein